MKDVEENIHTHTHTHESLNLFKDYDNYMIIMDML